MSDAAAPAVAADSRRRSADLDACVTVTPGGIEAGLWLPRPIDEVFAFFSEADNLERITPPWLSFRIATPGPIVMQVGTVIDYALKIRGVPVRWRSEITEWGPPYAFTDEQRRGPYRSWVHRHSFAEADGGTRVTDRVAYRVWGGRLFDRLFVRRDVERIFRFRQARLAELGG